MRAEWGTAPGRLVDFIETLLQEKLDLPQSLHLQRESPPAHLHPGPGHCTQLLSYHRLGISILFHKGLQGVFSNQVTAQQTLDVLYVGENDNDETSPSVLSDACYAVIREKLTAKSP